MQHVKIAPTQNLKVLGALMNNTRDYVTSTERLTFNRPSTMKQEIVRIVIELIFIAIIMCLIGGSQWLI